LRVFAARAAAEVERHRQERALREREASHRALAEEQAALRRVAMLVAAEAPEQELLDSVAGEVGMLLAADVASLVRCDGDRGTIVAGWSAPPSSRVPVGLVFDVEASKATREALRTGRPARADEAELPANDAALRELGIRSAVAAPIDVAGRRWVSCGRRGRARCRCPRAPSGGWGTSPSSSPRRSNAEAREELAASSARIVQAADAARRRIERNLHDGRNSDWSRWR
jgi:hypothetical protein